MSFVDVQIRHLLRASCTFYIIFRYIFYVQARVPSSILKHIGVLDHVLLEIVSKQCS